MQRAEMEELRQRDANMTALQAIGPRKKLKIDNKDTAAGGVVSISNSTYMFYLIISIKIYLDFIYLYIIIYIYYYFIYIYYIYISIYYL